LLLGAVLNPRGRVKKRTNNTTLEARALLNSAKLTAAEDVIRDLASGVPYVRQRAQVIVLAVGEHEEQEPPDIEWMQCATDRDMEVIQEIIDRAKLLVPNPGPRGGVFGLPGGEAIDVEACVAPSEPLTYEAFTVDNIPVPEQEDDDE